MIFKVIDKDDNQPLAGADVEVIVEGDTKHLTTDPAGYVTIDGVGKCGDVAVNAQKEGYLGDTIKADVATILQGEHNSTLLLKPGKGIVSFTVLDLENEQPIANAMAKLIINQNYIDEEIARIMDERYKYVLKLLGDHKDLIDYIANRLMEVETIDGKEFYVADFFVFNENDRTEIHVANNYKERN